MNQEKLENISDITKVSKRQLKKLFDSDLHIKILKLQLMMLCNTDSLKYKVGYPSSSEN